MFLRFINGKCVQRSCVPYLLTYDQRQKVEEHLRCRFRVVQSSILCFGAWRSLYFSLFCKDAREQQFYWLQGIFLNLVAGKRKTYL